MSSSNPSVDSNGSNTDTSTNNQNSGSSDFKGDARDSRLLRRNGKEEILRKKLQEEAKKKCADYFQGLAECAKQEGLLVVVKCQRRNKELSDCLDLYYNEEAFNKVLTDNGVPLPEKKNLFYRILEGKSKF